MPVLQALLFGLEQQLGWIAILVELLGKAPLCAGEGDEVAHLARLGILEPILVRCGIARQVHALPDSFTPAGIVCENREGATVGGKLGLLAGNIVGNAVLGLAGGVNVYNCGPRELVRIDDGFVEVVSVRAGGLGDVDVSVHHGQRADLFSALHLARNCRTKLAHLRVLAHKGSGGRLPTGV
ncbi:MAG: hypothetical protein HOC91_12695 [Nitrospinaceae bacterium]|nr:hypothetical protein [Nitrospinaceae bacterium]